MTIAETARACHYCSLPLPGSTLPATGEPEFCCVGCKIAASIAGDRGEEGASRAMLTRLGLAIFFSMNVMAFTMALWSQDWNGDLSAAARATFDLLRYGCLLFSLPVLLLLGGPLAASVWDELRSRRVTTDLLIAVGVTAAYVYSLVSVFLTGGHVYFEVACMVLTTLTLGRYLEATGKLKTTQALRDLESLLPDEVRVVEQDGERTISTAEIQPGDLLHLLPGGRIPVDGVIVYGTATIDEQLVTGESQPVVKESQSRVYGGTLNLDGDLQVRAAAAPTESALRKLIDAVVAAAAGKETYGRLADRITRWFLPAIMVIALATLAFHWQRAGLASGIMTSLSVVLIACPCALGLATPMALWAAVGNASRQGVLFHDGDCLSRLAKVDLICFDKTGTLTTDEPKLAATYLAAEADHDQVLAAARAVARRTSHPLAETLGASLGNIGTEFPLESAQTVAGRGVIAKHELFGDVYLGSLRLLEEAGIDAAVGLIAHRIGNESSSSLPAEEVIESHRDLALVALAYQGTLQAVFFFEETIRPGVASSIEALRREGLSIHMLTGDRRSRADSIAKELGIAARAELLPADKQEQIKQWQAEGHKVVMVGDGLNDGPSLAAADVGIALGCGADLSRDLADVCLLGNDPARIPEIIELSRNTVRTIRWNLLWAFGYNAAGVLLAACGMLHPIIAAAAMVGSSVLVVSNSLRLAGAESASLESGSAETSHAPESASRGEWNSAEAITTAGSTA